jgi:hypothetical protein
MGTSLILCCQSDKGLKPADWIAIAAIIINGGIGIWIINTLQNGLTNKRTLKDHFIDEIKEIREEYKSYFNNIYCHQINPVTVLSWFKLMNIKIEELMDVINKKYKINKELLKPYQRDLQELLTNNQDFINQYKTGQNIKFSDNSINAFMKFQSDYLHLFNDIIIIINDAV